MTPVRGKTMKKTVVLTILCLSLLVGCSAKTDAPAAQTSEEAPKETAASSEASTTKEANPVEEAISAYAAFLEGEIESLQENILTQEMDVRYAMIHLDDDDIPELAIPLGNSHSMGVGYYAYDGKEVKRVYVAGSFGTAYYEKNTGVVLGFYSGMGSYYTAIGVIKNGELTEEVRVQLTDIEAARAAQSFDGEGDGYYYSIWDGDEITKEEFDSLREPYDPRKRDYRLLKYDDLPRIQDADDIKEALRQSLAHEADLEKLEGGWGLLTDSAGPELLTQYYETEILAKRGKVSETTYYAPFVRSDDYIAPGDKDLEYGVISVEYEDLDGDGKEEMLLLYLEDYPQNQNTEHCTDVITFEVFYEDGGEVFSAGGGILDEDSFGFHSVNSTIFLRKNGESSLISMKCDNLMDVAVYMGLRLYQYKNREIREVFDHRMGTQDSSIVLAEWAEAAKQYGFAEDLAYFWENYWDVYRDESKITSLRDDPANEPLLTIKADYEFFGGELAWNPFTLYIEDENSTYADFKEQFEQSGRDWSEAEVKAAEEAFENGKYGVSYELIMRAWE